MEIAILAGGCFWCTEAVFQRLKGVEKVESGYTGGFIKNPPYREVCTGRTGHTEGIRITYDPGKISYDKILEVFFATHDPTTLNRQGNDVGTQYRSAIFYTNLSQKHIAEQMVQALNNEKVFANPIVTEIKEEAPFYLAEVEHQNYYNDHRSQGYCQFIIDPKIKKLTTQFTSLLKN